MSGTIAIIGDNVGDRREFWSGRINAAWNKSLVAIFEAGQLLADAKAELAHGEFQAMVETDLPFGQRTVQRLMAIARDERLTNTAHGSLLPPSWRTLHELTRLSGEQFQSCVESGLINPSMDRMDVKHFLKAENREAKHKDIAAKAATYQGPNEPAFALFYADPPWEFATYSDKGKDLSPAQHYPTMSDDEIKRLTIGDRWIGDMAGDDALLFLWCTPANFFRAGDVLEAWGFEYRSQRVWVKDKAGTGFYSRQKHEPLLIGVRGEPPMPIWVPDSVIDAPRGKHSEKPEEARQDLEKMYPHWGEDMRIELFARGPVPGWTVFGHES